MQNPKFVEGVVGQCEKRSREGWNILRAWVPPPAQVKIPIPALEKEIKTVDILVLDVEGAEADVEKLMVQMGQELRNGDEGVVVVTQDNYRAYAPFIVSAVKKSLKKGKTMVWQSQKLNQRAPGQSRRLRT